MRRSGFIAVGLVAGLGMTLAAKSQPAGSNANLDSMEMPDPGYSGPRFSPSFDFPAALVAEPRPWESVNFKTDPEQYMSLILQYVLEGQDTERWNVSQNAVRKWYHMPWMGPGGQGREYISGLTSERRSRPAELGPMQVKCRQNWAVGFYNPVGGHTLGKIWAPVASGASMTPDLSALPFPAGTVVAKALYTQADASEVPLLAGAPTIKARIVRDPDPTDAACPPDTVNDKPAEREETELRLLQMDVAVRDPNADTHTGWVFGTFIYDGRLPGPDPWKKLRPVGLMWGNDESLSDQAASGGAKPSESIVLSDFGLGRHFGRGGRMNGPVDNPASACLSCHMTAQTPSSAGMTPSGNAPWSDARCWFRNLGPASPFGFAPRTGTVCGTLAPNQKSLDYSLQLAVGVRNISFAEQNASRGGLNLFGMCIFGRRLLSVDREATVDGTQSMPISRDDANAGK